MDDKLQQRIEDAVQDPRNVGEMTDADGVGTAGGAASHSSALGAGPATLATFRAPEPTGKRLSHGRARRPLSLDVPRASADGASEFFRGPGNSADKQLRINSSGHILEWLSLALSDDEIRESWVADGANAVALMILELQNSDIESGTLYHATHGLILYYARLYDLESLGENRPYMPRRGHNRPWRQVAKKNVE